MHHTGACMWKSVVRRPVFQIIGAIAEWFQMHTESTTMLRIQHPSLCWPYFLYEDGIFLML